MLFIRGERPVFDRKYDIMKHPNIRETRDGNREAYYHGNADHMINDWQNIILGDGEYELYSEEDMELYFQELEQASNIEQI